MNSALAHQPFLFAEGEVLLIPLIAVAVICGLVKVHQTIKSWRPKLVTRSKILALGSIPLTALFVAMPFRTGHSDAAAQAVLFSLPMLVVIWLVLYITSLVGLSVWQVAYEQALSPVVAPMASIFRKPWSMLSAVGKFVLPRRVPQTYNPNENARRDTAFLDLRLIYSRVKAALDPQGFNEQWLKSLIADFFPHGLSDALISERSAMIANTMLELSDGQVNELDSLDLDGLTAWYTEERRRIDSLPVDTVLKQMLAAKLANKYTDLSGSLI